MKKIVRLLPGALMLGSVAFLGAAPAFAQEVPCESYSGACPPGGAVITPGGAVITPGGDEAPGTTVTTGTPVTAEAPGTTTTTDVADSPGTVSGQANGSTLPFTGGELTLMSVAGLGALAGGTALVVAGRRRRVA